METEEGQPLKNELIQMLLTVTLSVIFFGILGSIVQHFFLDGYINLFHQGLNHEESQQKLWADVIGLGVFITIPPLWTLNRDRRKLAGIFIDGLIMSFGIIGVGLFLGIGFNLSDIIS